MKTRKRRLRLRKKIVREYVDKLMSEAIRVAVSGNVELGEKISMMAKRLAKWAGLRIKKKWKYFFCKRCKSFIMPGITSRVRIRTNRSPHITIYCMKCGGYRRIPIKK